MTHSDPSQHRPDNTHSISAWARVLTAAAALLVVVTVLVVIAAPKAGAVSDAEELTRFGSLGSGAGQGAAGMIATDPVTGHVFTADNNSRINEFTPWGNFVKAFGWDVAPGPVNEQQEVRVRAATGQFKLSFVGSSTSDLPVGASGAQVEAALNALSSIGGASASVSAVPSVDGITPSVYVVAFKGSLAATNVAELTISNGTTAPNGGVPTSSLEVRTQADGTTGGTGLESCTAESGCKAGLPGSGAGQLSNLVDGLAVDSGGNIYAKEIGNLRVQKFDSAGRFVLMFGGEVNKTTNANICTKAQLEGGNVCGIGTPGTASGQFSEGFSDSVVLGSAGKLYAADNERIQRFNLQGEFEASIPVAGEQVNYLAFDPVSGDLYATYLGSGVHKLNPTSGAEIDELEGQNYVATDPAGNVYAYDSAGRGRVLQYNSNGDPLSPPTCCEAPPPTKSSQFFALTGLGTNSAGDLYVSGGEQLPGGGDSYIHLYGPGPVTFEAPPKVPPEIVAQFATSVGRTDAVLSAEIDPKFWTDTRFYIEYGTGKCSEGGCEAMKPLPPGAILSAKPTSSVVKSAGVFLEGLKAGTTYHYRFIAQSSGGGPVRGIGGKVGVGGKESSFTTYPAPLPAKTDCPNQQFRVGFSAPLTDCRAFEMVSPVDKNNGDIKSLLDLTGYNTALEQSSSDGDRFTYSSYRAFADAKSGAYTMQYMAARQDGVAWMSRAMNPPVGHAASTTELSSIENPYKAFSPDLCKSWLSVMAEPPLAPGITKGYRELYRHDDCGSGGYEALIGVEPTTTFSARARFAPELQGASADGQKAIIRVEDKLTPDAAGGGAWQTYYASSGGLRLVCVLPNGLPSGENCSGGTGGYINKGASPAVTELNRYASVTNAISDDGSRVYWTNSTGRTSGPGKVYLRLNPGAEQSEVSAGECVEAEKACTFRVSEPTSKLASRFFAANPDGSKALFEVIEGPSAGNLYEFDLNESEPAASEATLIAKKVGLSLENGVDGPFAGLLGASEDLSRVYFVSEDAIAGTTGATAGKPNLYLSAEGATSFIATLSKTDAFAGGDPNDTVSIPIFHVAKVSPDGSRLAFISTKSLTGYDNTDQVSGVADSEVYLYREGAPAPVCVSCSPSGARPLGRVVTNGVGGALDTAASIPVSQSIHHVPRALSADGRRLFFNSYDVLLPRDTNGKEDVYEWEEASGPEDCKEKGADLYVASSDGCLSLISSGESPSDSQFLDANPNGNDAFFLTNSSLLPQDPGLIDVYDARANGGLPAPPGPPAPCQGEACQNPPPPPNDPTPSSTSFKGAGNLTSKPRGRCAKGKARRKGRCVAKKQKHAKKSHKGKRAANNNRRTAR